jgi:hypothetical protein
VKDLAAQAAQWLVKVAARRAAVEALVAQELIALLEELPEAAVLTVAVVVVGGITHVSVMPLVVQFVLFGPAQLVASHQRIQVICNGTFYPH